MSWENKCWRETDCQGLTSTRWTDAKKMLDAGEEKLRSQLLGMDLKVYEQRISSRGRHQLGRVLHRDSCGDQCSARTSSPVVFRKQETDERVLVHGDDFMCSGQHLEIECTPEFDGVLTSRSVGSWAVAKTKRRRLLFPVQNTEEDSSTHTCDDLDLNGGCQGAELFRCAGKGGLLPLIEEGLLSLISRDVIVRFSMWDEGSFLKDGAAPPFRDR